MGIRTVRPQLWFIVCTARIMASMIFTRVFEASTRNPFYEASGLLQDMRLVMTENITIVNWCVTTV